MVNTKLDEWRAQRSPAEPWHPADVVAAVRKTGSSLRKLSIENGFNEFTMSKALRLCFPACHDVIAQVVGVPRQIIWPQFYDVQGKRMSPRERRRRQIAAELKRRVA